MLNNHTTFFFVVELSLRLWKKWMVTENASVWWEVCCVKGP